MSFKVSSTNDLITCPLFEQIREFSASKKTCSLHLVNKELEGYLSLKFGKPHAFYFKNSILSSYLLRMLLDECIVSLEVFKEIAKEELTFDEILEVLFLTFSEDLKFKELVDSLKDSFLKELTYFMLLDKETKCFHITNKELSEVLLGDAYLCILEKSNLSQISFGQIVLDFYKNLKEQDHLSSQGNAIKSMLEKDISVGVKEFDSHAVYLETVISTMPGLYLYSIDSVKNLIKAGELEVVSAVYDENYKVSEKSVDQDSLNLISKERSSEKADKSKKRFWFLSKN